MHYDWPCIRRITGFNPAQEGQEGCGVFWYTMIGPRCELELTDLPLLTAATLHTHQREHEWGSKATYNIYTGQLASVCVFTLNSANVLTQYAASSTVSSTETCMRPYVSVPRLGQYWSHLFCTQWNGFPLAPHYLISRKQHFYIIQLLKSEPTTKNFENDSQTHHVYNAYNICPVLGSKSSALGHVSFVHIRYYEIIKYNKIKKNLTFIDSYGDNMISVSVPAFFFFRKKKTEKNVKRWKTNVKEEQIHCESARVREW